VRYHQQNIVPEHIVAEAKAQRRHELRLLSNPDCRDPEHPGCQSCEPEMFPEPVPEGYITAEEWAEEEIKLIRTFAQEQDDDRSCAAGWTERFHDFVNDLSRGMK